MKAKETAVVFDRVSKRVLQGRGETLRRRQGRDFPPGHHIQCRQTGQRGSRKKEPWSSIHHFCLMNSISEIIKWLGIVKAVADGDAFREGTWGADIIDELKPAEGDRVVTGKCTLCGFNNTDLDQIIKDARIKNVVIGGFLTNFCVGKATARTAYDKGVQRNRHQGCNRRPLHRKSRTTSNRKSFLFWGRRCPLMSSSPTLEA